jgi:hypothetical protein
MPSAMALAMVAVFPHSDSYTTTAFMPPPSCRSHYFL